VAPGNVERGDQAARRATANLRWKHGLLQRQHNWRMVGRLQQTAWLRVDHAAGYPFRRCGGDEKVVDTDALVLPKLVSEILPKCIMPRLIVEMSERVDESSFE
jgi:hypothetical protein